MTSTQSAALKLDQLLMPVWGDVQKANRLRLGDGWSIAEDFLNLHRQGLEMVAATSGQDGGTREGATLLLGIQGFRLYSRILAETINGYFDVAALLMRPLFDIQAMLYAVAIHEDKAQAYVDDRLTGSAARKLLVTDIRGGSDHDLTQFLDERWRNDADAANALAHPNLTHASKVLTREEDDDVKPHVFGHVDSVETEKIWIAATEHEHLIVGWFRAAYTESLGND